jgi:hypothetical protein
VNRDVVTSVMGNAIGWALFSDDGRPVTVNDEGVPSIVTTNEEARRCLRAAEAAYDVAQTLGVVL